MELYYICFFHTGVDGMTPYQRIKGKPWTIALPAFGECVEYKKRTRHKLEDRWDTGVYLGVKHDTTERIVGTSTGCYVVQSIRRVPEDRRYDSQLLANVKGLPWKPIPEGPEDQGVMELPEPVNLEPECPEVPALPTETADAAQSVRRYYITTRDLEKYGFTEGCPACDAIRAKTPRAGISHAPGCRERIEKAVSSDPNRNNR